MDSNNQTVPKMYVFHLKSCKQPYLRRHSLFKFVCKGSLRFNTCQCRKENDYFIECTAAQRKLLMSCDIPFSQIKKSSDWFYNSFGVIVKPFFTISQIALRETSKEEYYANPKTERIYFRKFGDLYEYDDFGNPSDCYADIPDRLFLDFSVVLLSSKLNYLFKYPYSHGWWLYHFHIDIVDLSLDTKPVVKRRGPKGELHGLVESAVHMRPSDFSSRRRQYKSKTSRYGK